MSCTLSTVDEELAHMPLCMHDAMVRAAGCSGRRAWHSNTWRQVLVTTI